MVIEVPTFLIITQVSSALKKVLQTQNNMYFGHSEVLCDVGLFHR